MVSNTTTEAAGAGRGEPTGAVGGGGGVEPTEAGGGVEPTESAGGGGGVEPTEAAGGGGDVEPSEAAGGGAGVKPSEAAGGGGGPDLALCAAARAWSRRNWDGPFLFLGCWWAGGAPWGPWAGRCWGKRGTKWRSLG